MEQESIDEQSRSAALKLKWALGLNYKIYDGVHNLTSAQSKQLFYAVGNTGVLYDYQNNTQRLLQGHCNSISCTAFNREKGIVITADSGEDSMLVVWDIVTGVPKRTIFDPHSDGVLALDVSADGQLIVTLSKADQPNDQMVTLWKWEEPQPRRITSKLDINIDCLQRFVKLNEGQNEFATTGQSGVIFWRWQSQQEKGFTYYVPLVNKRNFTQTVFIPNSTQAVTGTKDGAIIVWDISLIMQNYSKPQQRRAIKQVNLMNNNNKIDAMKKNIIQPHISVLKMEGRFLVVGSSNGCVRFYDDQYRIQAWFQDIDIGAIHTISFSSETTLQRNQDSTDQQNQQEQFVCPDFIVVDDKARITLLRAELFEKIDKQQKRGQVLMQSIVAPIVSSAVRPHSSTLVVSCQNNFIYSWDYQQRGSRITVLNQFYNDQIPNYLAYSPSGKYLAVATKVGTVYIQQVDATNKDINKDANKDNSKQNNKDKNKSTNKQDWPYLYIAQIQRYKPNVTMLAFAPDSRHLAAMDQYFGVTLFVLGDKNWTFGGKIRVHTAPLRSIAFGQSMDQRSQVKLRLFSVSQDMTLAQYDVLTKKQQINETTKFSRLKLKSIFPIEQECFPTACIWYPINPFKQNILLTVNQQYKLKLWSMLRDSMKICKKTCLGPTYGGQIVKLLTLSPEDGDKNEKYLAYSTKQKVIGIIKLPLDGNPNNAIGLIAHAGKITSISSNVQGKYIFTSGSTDFCLNIWTVDYNSLRQNFTNQTGDDPFPQLLQGGPTGQTMADLKDFFYYSQIRSKDQHTTKARKLDGKVPLQAIANMMRSMGFYPTQKQIDNMQNQIKFSSYHDSFRQTLNQLDLSMFLKLFVNHRPVFGISKNQIQGALNIILQSQKPQADKQKSGSLSSVSKQRFFSILRNQGQKMTEDEIKQCQKILVGQGNQLPEEIDAYALCHKLLGFEDPDYDPQQQDEDEYGDKMI